MKKSPLKPRFSLRKRVRIVAGPHTGEVGVVTGSRVCGATRHYNVTYGEHDYWVAEHSLESARGTKKKGKPAKARRRKIPAGAK